MEIINAIKQRRSIRKFKDVSISKKQINEILNCGRLAPSAKNRQPWKFVVITNKNKINDIINIMIQSHSSEDENYDINVLKTVSSVLPTADAMKEAPVLIFIYQKIDDNWTVGDNLSIGACIENMCLSACGLGFGTLWIRDIVYAKDKISDYINMVSSEYKLNSALCVGIANENPKPRPRNKLKDITKWIE